MAAVNAAPSVIDEEVARFDALGADWWDPEGPMAPLHRLNPARIAWLRDAIAGHFKFSLSRLGAEVTGLDPAPTSIEIARAHALESGARPTYRVGTVEELAREGARFDVVAAMEVIEHVADVPAFVAAAGSLVKPGGLFALSTLNRTFKSFALAIVGAEYVLRWLPAGTHRWEQFVTPDELADALEAAGLTPTQRRGMSFDPLRGEWSLTRDLSVNYFMAARR
jgi:2-polyprenyl-6-hydroxyphenyl methylase / 3-demethylubiquinone-9 3-methyltransferase